MKSPAIPPIVTLKNPYSVNNVSFMFGGKYSNQTIGHISITHYRKFVFSSTKSVYTFRHEESYRLNPAHIKAWFFIPLENTMWRLYGT